ncbi:Stp1/IreP family PP2C-type Ser/Thr phosphatase [Clostridium sp. 19966]|uniref:Stp1/IreP family PP2C-type Ser/Thr phosphatase n=1 Tax=Clostridium sp. 19966 TaxID=2768166 RepID=UPI0028E08F9F|nr:Stp1/IreP family PP2C-type Ser/Thr phosphatase [Clostridium sp. 19966]MDT8716472.1 Stp1/IreP family PP2C-type Ser/Thr phosphatase [Clostridium sp. 19966]
MIGALSDIGNKRETNEDYISYYECENIGIYVVADGMGGHNAGEIASKTAGDKIIDFIKSKQKIDDMEVVLIEAIKEANKEVYERAQEDEGLNGMGTTITACITDGNVYIIANVGDSSCFVIKDGIIKKVTKDHSLVQQLVDEGSITEEEAKTHPNKNIITRALGTCKEVEVDTFKIDWENFERFVLCTDGLTNEVNYEEINKIVIESDTSLQACRSLVELAKERGGTDNITVMVIGGDR